jgi:hypothetical protein
MDNVTFNKIERFDGLLEVALIAHADGSFTSMTKAHFDKLQAEQSTPIVEVE